ncbi:hypothetical protein [Paludibacterium paludis]|uniref:hypothetical protein n=1 Tax=Paludibacterium paludis TaxID=1225769 RepID=UPI0016726853|nr:hypothetical protein [Paludibacterium paludis]
MWIILAILSLSVIVPIIMVFWVFGMASIEKFHEETVLSRRLKWAGRLSILLGLLLVGTFYLASGGIVLTILGLVLCIQSYCIANRTMFARIFKVRG